MHTKMFDRPVYLRERKDLVLEITNLDDAIDFLEEWSKGDRDIIHDATLKTCYLAHDGHKPVQVARDALRSCAQEGHPCESSCGVAVDDQGQAGRRSSTPVNRLSGVGGPRSRSL